MLHHKCKEMQCKWGASSPLTPNKERKNALFEQNKRDSEKKGKNKLIPIHSQRKKKVNSQMI